MKIVSDDELRLHNASFHEALSYSGAFILSTIETFFRDRPITRLTMILNRSVNRTAYRKLTGRRLLPNMTASTSTVVMTNLCKAIPPKIPKKIPIPVRA